MGGVACASAHGWRLIVACVLKLPDPAASVRAVRAYQSLPEAIVPTVGYLLPVLEVVIGVCLVVGLLTRFSAAVSAVLFVAFIIGISYAWNKGLSIECGCFGGGGYKKAGASLQVPRGDRPRCRTLLLSALPDLATSYGVVGRRTPFP